MSDAWTGEGQRPLAPNDSDGDFSLEALYVALDEKRRKRGLTWPAAAREISESFARTPARPISASTLTGIRTRRMVEGDGVLQMLRWLNRAPESFIAGHHDATDVSTALPATASNQILRFDTRALYEALNARRAERGLTWTDVALEIGGVSASGLTHLANGGRTAFPQVMRLARWLGRSAATFTRASDR